MKQQYIKPPLLSTSFSGGKTGAKERFANILNTRVRPAGALAAAVIAIMAITAGTLVACGGKESAGKDSAEANAGVSDSRDIDTVIAEVLLNDENAYADTEFFTEGHIILGNEGNVETGEEKIYAVTSVGGYSFMNGMFVKYSGSGAIPAVITVADGKTDIEYPMDGDMYNDSLKKMFPKEIYKDLIYKDYYPELKAQEHAKALEYLKSIGRDSRDAVGVNAETKIGEYADLNAELPEVSVEAQNEIEPDLKEGEMCRFPMFMGNREYLENGKRYIYDTRYKGNEENGILNYTKFDVEQNVIYSVSYIIENGHVVDKKVQGSLPWEN